MSKVASEVVGGILNEFHLAIKMHDIEQAKSLFERVKSTFVDMEENQDVLTYFSLLGERYRMMLYDARGERPPDRAYFMASQSKCVEETNHLIDYYFYFFEAMYESYSRNFDRAISLYKIAEHKLADIPDKIEHAEFYIKLGWLYMSLRQNQVSLNYAKDAMTIFKMHEGYEKRLAVSLVVMGANYMHIERFKEAEHYFKESIKISEKIADPFLEAMLYHDISIFYSTLNRSEECIHALQKALSNQEWCESCYFINSLYMLTRELFKIGEKEAAMTSYQKGQVELSRNSNNIYEKKINIIYELYCCETSDSMAICLRDLHDLEKLNDLDGVHDLCLLISRYYEDKGHYKEALEFVKMAVKAENKMKSLGSEV
ncbi:Rap family tetratricopeptide repeat protein [Bacillus changyiensis]|uniref:Rap family tetratricopeptide repeat protein n=1 Tax=Bacillus changyiensis TaxID=3004103 RepID=UPI0022E34619|nr:Rap family tetratricopeptide repeat protein [Bacillus changyiensis]MDA1477152.1 aspartate phosphatase [Bacillus changyiensis]